MKARHFLLMVVVLLAFEALSFFGWRYPVVGAFGWLVAVGCTLLIGVRRPYVVLGIVMAELALGGKGYLLSLPLGDADISLRLGIFLAGIFEWLIHVVRQRTLWGTQWSFRWLWLGWIGIALWATIVGLLRGNGLGVVFTDANAFLFLGLAPAFGLLRTREQFYNVLAWLAAAGIVLAVKTALVQGLFTHYPSTDLVLLYKWIRDTGVGEVTYIIGHLYRVFFQSHVYGLLAFFTGIGFAIAQPARRWLGVCSAVLGAYVVVVSLSRSFWLGAAAAIFCTLIAVVVWKPFRQGFARTSVYAVLAIGLALVAFQWTLNFPLLWGGGGSGGTLVRARSDIQTESAASSRRELLPVITKAIFSQPVFGSGFGTTLTYATKDPRVNTSKAPGGTQYTTTAFELGYHAFAMQFGLPMFALWLGLLAAFLYRGVQFLRIASPDRAIVAGLWLSFAAVCALHATTPYLNHPLGFGFTFLLAAALANMQTTYARR